MAKQNKHKKIDPLKPHTSSKCKIGYHNLLIYVVILCFSEFLMTAYVQRPKQLICWAIM